MNSIAKYTYGSSGFKFRVNSLLGAVALVVRGSNEPLTSKKKFIYKKKNLLVYFMLKNIFAYIG